jgi:TonB family protein
VRFPDGFPPCPFPGMRPFEPSDTAVFFGQDENIEALIDKLGRERFVAVLGESGVGKSSLVKAGLIPELRRGNKSLWHIPVFKPGTAPLEELAAALQGARLNGDAGISEIVLRLRAHRASLKDLIGEACLPGEERVLIMVDQFEELFRFRRPDDPRFAASASVKGSQEEDAALLVKLLLTAATTSVPPVYVLLTMRAEFLGDCAAFYELGEAMNKGTFLLPRMARDQYAAVIAEPLHAYGCDVETSLIHELLNETMAMSEDGLPLLQHALRRMWDRRNEDVDRAFSIEDFMPTRAVLKKHPKTAAIQVLLDAHLDEIYADLDQAGLRDPVARLVRSLGEYDHKSRLIRRPLDWDTARAIAFHEDAQTTPQIRQQNGERLRRIIGAFRDPSRGRSFLMCEPDRSLQRGLEGQSPKDCARLELSHEVILRQWSRLAEWFRDEKKNAEQFQYVAEQANRYPRQAGLLSGPALQLTEKWFAEFAPTALWAERYSQYDARTRTFRYDLVRTSEFVRKSVRARRKKRFRNAGIALLVLALGIVAWLGWRQQIKRADERIRAEIDKQGYIKDAAEKETQKILAALKTAQGGERSKLLEDLQTAQNKVRNADSQTSALQEQVQTVSLVDQRQISDLRTQAATLNAKVSELLKELSAAQTALKDAPDQQEFDRIKDENARLKQTTPSDQDASRFWKLMWSSSDPDLFEEYSRLFPLGRFRSIAESRKTKLRALPQLEAVPEHPSQPLAAPVRVSGAVLGGSLTRKVTPVYPPLAKQARISGQVRFNVLIDSDGNIASLDIVSGHSLLVTSAMEAVLQWQYKPTLLNGKPISVLGQIDINFSLSQ